MSEHRVTMLGASWRRFEDPTLSRDPRVRSVVAALATLPAPQPRAEFRAELRAQLVAITPRFVGDDAESGAPLVDIVATKPRPAPTRHTPNPAPAAARHADSFAARVRGIRFGRPLAVAASVITAFALLLGGAVWMSQKALPGDTLYGLKRASESVELATAGSDTAKAGDYLKFATTRAQEVSALLARASAHAAGDGAHATGGAVDPGTADLISSTLASADSDVKSAAALLGEQAVKSHSAGPLDTMTKWAPGQVSRLQQIAAAMPSSTLRSRTDSSALLVTAALVRAKTLAPKVGCQCLSSSGRDDLGPVPCGTCSPAAGAPALPGGHPGSGAPATSSATNPAGNTVVGSDPNAVSVAPPATTAGTTAPSGSASSSRVLQLPPIHLPTPTKSLPVNVDSCGVSASLGPIGIGIGLCSGLHLSTHH